jgi:hypothetical protein
MHAARKDITRVADDDELIALRAVLRTLMIAFPTASTSAQQRENDAATESAASPQHYMHPKRFDACAAEHLPQLVGAVELHRFDVKSSGDCSFVYAAAISPRTYDAFAVRNVIVGKKFSWKSTAIESLWRCICKAAHKDFQCCGKIRCGLCHYMQDYTPPPVIARYEIVEFSDKLSKKDITAAVIAKVAAHNDRAVPSISSAATSMPGVCAEKGTDVLNVPEQTPDKK